MAIEFQSISIVGCGPGSLDYLTPASLRAIEQAEVLVGAKRLLDLFAASPAERIVVSAEIGEVLDHIAVRADRQRIAVLVTGDPGLFSLAKPVIERFGRTRCRVIPGVSSVQTAFARIGVDWADARIISIHKEYPVNYAQSHGCGQSRGPLRPRRLNQVDFGSSLKRSDARPPHFRLPKPHNGRRAGPRS